MTLRPGYSLVHSEFNEFLFAFVGEEKGGLQLTVLSALARLGFDPWEEAARLSGLSKEAATAALTDAILGLAEGEWKGPESRSIAVRLVSYLPRRSSSSESASQGGHGDDQGQKSGTWNWLVWIAFAAVLIALFWQQTG